MRLLTRAEELILLAVLKLGEEAYAVPILENIEKTTRRKWTMGTVYIPLYRLTENGYLESTLANPTRERGGKKKRYYRLTEKGKQALRALREIESDMWADVSGLALEPKP
jgi:PadR family transcriptional regulator